MSDNRARIWFSLFVLAVFCFGGAAGFVLGRHLPPPDDSGAAFGLHMSHLGPMLHSTKGRPPGPPPLLPPPEVLEKIEDELQLDPAQRTQVQKILDEHRDRLEQVHSDAQQRFDQEARGLHAEIRALLRPDQQQRFDRFLEQHHMQ
jgi:uncharacterized membrane protein